MKKKYELGAKNELFDCHSMDADDDYTRKEDDI